jgi:hypothetical protein
MIRKTYSKIFRLMNLRDKYQKKKSSNKYESRKTKAPYNWKFSGSPKEELETIRFHSLEVQKV